MRDQQNLWGPLTAAAVVSLFVAGANAGAALPVVDRLEPLGVVRGEETTVVFHGQRVKDAREVLIDVPGIEVLGVKPLDNRKVEVTLKTDPELPPGLYPVRLVTATGIANLRLLGVGAMPVIQEQEPNDDFESPQEIELNRTIEGVVDREDVDYYRVRLREGQKLTVEIEGLRLAYSLRNRNILDPYIAILDEGRFEVAASDDTALLQQDGVCSFTAAKDGEYTILVRDTAFGGSPESGYRLHVGTFPRPLAVYPAGGTPGSLVETTMIDVDGSVTAASFQLPGEPSDAWGATAETEDGLSPSPNGMRVNELPVVLEVEPNDDYRKAPEFQVPAAFCGVIEKPGDFDCFSFDAQKGRQYRVEVFARNVLRSPLDAVLNVFGPDDKTIQSADDSRGSLDPFLEFSAKEDGKHTVRIYDHLRGGSELHQYRIEVTETHPEVNLSLKELRRDEAMVAPVPAGGATGLVVQTQRSGYNGEVTLDLAGLPAGVTATTFPVPAGRNEIPVLLTAENDAEPQAALFDIVASGDAQNFSVMGRLRQQHKLVLGQNRRHMWAYDTQRAAVAIADPAPFRIELVQPQTPIVRNGSKDLVVRVERSEGFDAAVSLRTLYNPPGIGINNSRKIDAGKTEVTVPITANGSAAMGPWPVIFVASYGTDNGTAEIATNAIMLDVQDSLFKYDFPKSAAEQGTETTVAVAMEVLRELEGDAEVELVGLPNGVSSPNPIQPIDPDGESVAFPIVVAADAKVGNHKTLVVKSRVTVGDEVIVQTTGTGELRVDEPLPAEPEPSDQVAESEKKQAPRESAPPKPLSRLEQLRQQKAQAGN